jgi:hypothetical protein
MYYYDTYDTFQKYLIGTKLEFIFFPRKCFFSNKILWLELAYKQTAIYSGPGEPIFEDRWYDKNEFLMAKIKGVL